MDFDEVIRRRRMVRHFSDRPVGTDVLDSVLDAARRGPSAGFSQGVDLLVLEGQAQTGQFFELTSDPEFLAGHGAVPGAFGAPVIVVPLGDPDAYVSRYAEKDKAGSRLAGAPAGDWPSPYWLVDSSFAVMLLLLAATANGLGALFFGLHADSGPLFDALGVPEGKVVIGAVALGYEAPAAPPGSATRTGSPIRRPRRPIDEVVHRGRW